MTAYAVNNDLAGTKQALTSTYKTILSVTAATASLCYASIYDVMIGTNGTPADNFLEWDISHQTAAGTATSGPPVPLQPQTQVRVAGSTGLINYTAEGTIAATSSVFYIGINQRASYRWVASPGSELIVPPTNLNGLALRVKSAAYTGTATGQVYFTE